MKLGEENTFYYNEELKMHVERGKEEEYRAKKKNHLPPPTDKQLATKQEEKQQQQQSETTTISTPISDTNVICENNGKSFIFPFVISIFLFFQHSFCFIHFFQK